MLSISISTQSVCSSRNTLCTQNAPVFRNQRKFRYPLSLNANSACNPADLPAVQIPESQESAIEAAVAAVRLHVEPLLKSTAAVAAKKSSQSNKKVQGFSSGPSTSGRLSSATGDNVSYSSYKHFAIEIPSADRSPSAAADLGLSVIVQLHRQLQTSAGVSQPSLSLVLPDEATVAAATSSVQQRRPGTSGAAAAAVGGLKMLSLQQACRSSEGLSGVLVVAEPKVADVALVEQLLTEVWTGQACVLLNPEFPASSVPEAYQKISDAILVVWSFLPLMVSGLLSNKEGAVIRLVGLEGTSTPESSWRILYKVGNKMVQVGSTKLRPRPEDLELAMMNASAAVSPLTQAVKMLRSLIPSLSSKNSK
ncbi:hypothetical protein CEUSTIGMA_g11070.t1 [Chlamydomonas eustigma]|uniref:DUF1995 domain-containing protein n=1 Tax=Chlamydomonas eustigma TaxID=1157962 RepID=A0A250XKU5_9CHLO|nr:hypothetical protein CEUSTIGMA_g11070.t1 [Chlamydomonas eustigma]|eukprot:GAX83646.1 hypothetical protein CEUSTIGMA_g11070.t1 [Chlamydomonas eustigma]